MGLITAIIVLGAGLIVLLSSITIVRPYEKGVVERLGKYRTTLDPGLHFVVPFIDKVRKVDLREHVIDVPPQEVICKDNVVVTVDAVVYYQIIDPVKAIYNVSNLLTAIVKLAQTNLRAIIGEMELDETLSGRDKINSKLQAELDKITDRWGVKVTRVEIQRIDPPKDIQQAMAEQMKAEREKRAMILKSEGYKQSQINMAEGDKQAQILRAEAEKQAKILQAEAEKQALILRAEGEKQAILRVVEALANTNDKYLLYKYIENLPEVAKPGNMIVPYDSDSLIKLFRLIRAGYDDNVQRPPEAPKPPDPEEKKKKRKTRKTKKEPSEKAELDQMAKEIKDEVKQQMEDIKKELTS